MASITATKATFTESALKKAKQDLMDYELDKQQGKQEHGIYKVLELLTKKYADEHITFYMLKNMYYNEVYGMYDSYKDSEEYKETKVFNIDDSITEFSKQSAVELPQIKVVPFVVGDRVSIKITRIAPYGAFADTTSGYGGLLHISEVSRDYTTDLTEHFSEGDVIENVRIIKVEKDGKLAFSTVDLPLTKKTGVSKPEVQVSTIADRFPELKAKVSAAVAPSIDVELDEMGQYIQGIVGAITPAGKELLQKVRDKHNSIFKMSRAILETEKAFEPDMSVLFIQQVIGRLDDGL